MIFLSVRCLIIYWVPVGAAANSSWDANTVLTCGKTNRTVQSGEAFIFLSSINAIHSHPDAASATDIKHLRFNTKPRAGDGKVRQRDFGPAGRQVHTTPSVMRHP